MTDLKSEKTLPNYNGMRFCDMCLNLLMPMGGEDRCLIFKCRLCGDVRINFDNPNQEEDEDEFYLLSRKKQQIGKAQAVVDKDFALDPTMPRKKIDCPKCGFDEAV